MHVFSSCTHTPRAPPPRAPSAACTTLNGHVHVPRLHIPQQGSTQGALCDCVESGGWCAARPATAMRMPMATAERATLPRRWSACAPRRGGVLYVVPRPTQTRTPRSARTWWACCPPPLACWGSPGGGTQRTVPCTGRGERRGHPACSGGSPECVWPLRRVPRGLERDNRILEPATGPLLLLEDPVAGRPTPPCAPRRGTRSPDIDSVLVRGVFVRLRVRSCIVPKGIHEGWYPANTDAHLSTTRAPGVLGESGRAV